MYISFKEHTIQFVSAFDKLQEQRRRKLFDIQDIDNQLNFLDRKNICIINRYFKKTSNNFLYSLFAQFCIDLCFSNNNNSNKENKTILIDAGNGNNLAYIHQNLIRQSIRTGFKINKVLDNIVVVRVFTFYQLANIIINEIPILINKIDCNIQVIVIDLLDTLSKTKGKNSQYNLKKDFDENKSLLDEIIDKLIHISNKLFVIVCYDYVKDVVEKSITSKFKNAVEISEQSILVC